jgi:hypothetical protein
LSVVAAVVFDDPFGLVGKLEIVRIVEREASRWNIEDGR